MSGRERRSLVYEAFAAALAAEFGDVEEGGTGFGSDAFKSGGKIFAMPVKGTLVLKLPKVRVSALVAAGAGVPSDPGHGRAMKELKL